MLALRRDKLGVTLIVFSIALLFTAFPIYAKTETGKKNVSQLMIITSFPPEFYGPFIEKFNKSRPDIRVQILNKKTTAAIAEIIRGNNRKFDLFWSSSPDAFVVLKETGRLRQSGYVPHYPPISQKQPYYDDPDGWFYNFALSGVGFMWNEKTLAESGITDPGSWQDLTDSRFYGQVAMSTPSRSGTNHLIVETILQDMGWENGWKYILQIAGNFKTITARSFRVPDGVAEGKFGVGLVIDFLAFAKSHADNSNQFSYGEPTFLMPARVALLQDGQNISEAVQFIDFLLSKEGQDVLLQPGINRLPVSKEPFSSYEVKIPYLISLIRQGKTKVYDTELSTRRYHLVNTLFDQAITYRLLDRKRVWKKILDFEDQYGKEKPEIIAAKKDVIDIICRIPVSVEQSLGEELTELFAANAAMNERGERKRQLFQEWDLFVTKQLDQALEVIDSVGNELGTAASGSKESK